MPSKFKIFCERTSTSALLILSRRVKIFQREELFSTPTFHVETASQEKHFNNPAAAGRLVAVGTVTAAVGPAIQLEETLHMERGLQDNLVEGLRGKELEHQVVWAQWHLQSQVAGTPVAAVGIRLDNRQAMTVGKVKFQEEVPVGMARQLGVAPVGRDFGDMERLPAGVPAGRERFLPVAAVAGRVRGRRPSCPGPTSRLPDPLIHHLGALSRSERVLALAGHGCCTRRRLS
jgi:hypothetical protein